MGINPENLPDIPGGGGGSLFVGVYNNHPTLEHTTDHLDTRPILKKSKNEFVVLKKWKKIR
jgi:hypothetical protein